MKTKQFFTVLAVALMAILVLPTTAAAIDFSEKELESLQAGKTVKKPLPTSRQDGFYGGTGWVLIDAPADVVWAALQDTKSYPKFFPQTLTADEVGRKGDKSLVKFELGYKILKVGYYLNIEREEENKKITFKMVSNKPHDIEHTAGYWRLFPQPDGRTLVGYGVTLQVPSGIVIFLGDSMEKTMEHHLIILPKYLKKWVESPNGNRYRGTMTAKK